MVDYINFDIDRVVAYEHIAQLIQDATDIIELNKKNIANLDGFEQLILPIEKIDNELQKNWSLLDHLQNVDNKNELRESHQQALDKITDFQTKYALDKELMGVYEKASNQKNLNVDEKLLLDHALLNFKLAGVDLDDQKKQRIFEISQALTQLSEKFGNNLLDTSERWTSPITAEELHGLSEGELEYLEHIAKQNSSPSKYLLNLSAPCYQMIMTNCSHRGLRERLYKAYAHRASRYDENGPAYDNAAVAVSILNLRREEAALLGYPEYAQYALSKRFAHTPESVSTFLKQLIIAIKPKAEKEFIKIKTLAINDGLTEIEPWDVAFYSEQLKKQELSIHDEEIREYFTLDRVLPLMLETFGDMYGFKTRQEHFPSWHKDVISLSLLNNKTQDPIGVLYIDLYARNGKRQGAWMSGAGSKVDYKSWKALPVAYIVCNFRKDDEGTLSFDDLQTLFHEFGHSLHHLLTQRTLPSIAGINQVPWDIVELPSQLSEQWCFEKSFLKKLSAHRDTKQPLSDDLINNLIKTRQFMASLFLLRQLEFASFDWGIHGKDHINDVVGYWHEIRRDIAVTPSIATHAFPLSFSHIFDGGYAAGYYSYLWADAYVYQVYEKMKAYKTMHSAGTAFKEKFLTIGPSLSLQESLHEFLGEEQSIKPFLKAYGI